MKDHLIVICTEHVTTNTTWNEVPIVSLKKHTSKSLFQRITRKILNKEVTIPQQDRVEILNNIILEYKIDLVFIHFLNYAVSFKKILNSLPCRVFIHCHGYDVHWDLCNHLNPEERIHSINYLSEIRSFEKNVHFIANSNFTKRILLEAGIGENNISIKYLGVPIEQKKTVVDKKHGYISILYLGRLIDCKGPDIVIQAFELACDKGLKGELIIAGDGPLRVTCELYKAKSKYKKNIHFLGAISAEKGIDIRSKADIFTAHNCLGPLTKQEEAYGVSIIEAMAAELPVVSAHSGALNETVIHDETGILVEQWDIEAHAKAFLLLANNSELRKRMGKAGRLRVEKLFSYENEQKTLLKIFNK
ncbi:hypothetical protein GCM10027443_13800 [Pontibacter brevis]